MINNNQFKSNPFPQFQQFQQPIIQNQVQQIINDQITIEGITYKKFQPPLGQGTEGIVYKGQNLQTYEIVAIKEYKIINHNEKKAIEAIQRNNFSHIIGIKGILNRQNSCPIIVMEFAHGEFFKFMQTQEYKNLTYDQKNDLFLQMVQGVEQLHQLGLFHRDLKPENFVYIKDSQNKITIKLIDFGLVKETSDKMQKTSKVGTPYYMAPEVLGNQNSFYDKSVDIWSLGAIWYELLTDETFFQGNTLEEIFYKIQSCQQTQIEQLIKNNNKIQPKEKDLIKKMLCKLPFQRIQLKDLINQKDLQPEPIIDSITIEGVTYKKFQPPLGQRREGIVYKGQNNQTQGIVAIIEYKPINDNEKKAIQAIQRNNFSHIIGIKGVLIQQNACPIIVMEYAHGEFNEFMQQQEYKNLTYDQKNDLFLQMVQGVEQLHQLGLFHRDLKPENFVYIKDSQNKITIKLIDFGLVKETSDQLKTMGVGTVIYMAPEAINENYDKSVDIWSLGAIWYELLTDQTFLKINKIEEIDKYIKNCNQMDIDQQIQNNNIIQQKEKDLIKRMLCKDPSKRIQLKDFIDQKDKLKQEYIQSITEQGLFVITILSKKKQELKKELDQIKQKQIESIKIKNQEEFKQKLTLLKEIKDNSEREKYKKLCQQKKEEEQKKIEDQIQKKKTEIDQQIDEQLKLKMDEFQKKMQNEIDQQKMKAQLKFEDKMKIIQEDKKQQILGELKLEYQNEMEQCKKQKDEELDKELLKFIEMAKRHIEEQLKELYNLEKQIIQMLVSEIKKMVDQWKQQEKEKEEKVKAEAQAKAQAKELEEKKQLLIIQFENDQSQINMFIQNLKEKQKKTDEINIVDQKKQQLSNYINKELQKYSETIYKNEQKLQLIQQAQTKDMLIRYDSDLAQERQQYIQDYNIIMENITKEQSLLEQQVNNKQISDLKEKEQKLKMEQELQQKKEQEQKLKKEKEQYQQLLQSVKQQSTQQSTQIQRLSEQINFYQGTQQNIQGKEKIQDVIKQHQKITQDIYILEEKEKIILQFDTLQQQINLNQQFNSKLEQIQQAQNRLKSLIEEANKSIQQIDRLFIDQHHKQIDDLNTKLNDCLDKFKYQSQNQKYANQINQVINQIGVIFGQLNSLKELISQRTQAAYQQYNQRYNQIQQQLKDFNKQHKQLNQQIYNDQQIEQINGERIKKQQMTQEKLNQFKQKMNQLKQQIQNLINNEQCNNNEQIKNLINNKLIKMDQTISEQQKQFDNLNQLNQQNSCEIINNQIKLLEEFYRKLNEVEVNEIELVDQLKMTIQNIVAQNKSEQEKEIINLNNQLQNRYRQFLKVLQSINLKEETITFYKQMKEKQGILHEQVKQEINILEDNSKVKGQNEQILEEKLKEISTKKGQSKQEIEKLLKRLQETNQQKGNKLQQVYKKVSEKELEIKFRFMDDNLIKNYVDLKIQEDNLSKSLNDINENPFNQQLNPQQLKELKEYILKVYSQIDELMMKIPQEDEIQEFNKAYQQNLESYQKLYALVNYIKQYHLTRYYERIKENANQQKNIQQNNNESEYKKQFQSKQNLEQDENTKKEKEAQYILQSYDNVLNGNYNMMKIEVMEKEKEEIEKQIEKQENSIKQKNLVKLRSNLRDQIKIKEIINIKQYYKISEFAQGQMINIMQKQNIKEGQNNQQGQENQQVQQNQY